MVLAVGDVDPAGAVDLDVVDDVELAFAGATQCGGPTAGRPCPVIAGLPCWMVDRADVLVYDVWASGDDGRTLINDLRELYPDKPVVLTSPGPTLGWVETEGVHRLTPLVGAPTRARLVAAVESALAAPAG